MKNDGTDVLVVGAGMAGLTAARALTDAGKNVVVVDARPRVGGRILTEMVDGEAIELGAEFVHGKPPELWKLLDEAALSTWELDGDQLCWKDGKLEACAQGREDDFQWLDALKKWRGADCSFAEYLERGIASGESRERLTGYVEGFNAADAQVIGVAALGKQQAAEDEIEGDRLFRVRGGYSRVVDFLTRKILVGRGIFALDTPVNAIRWQRGRVEVECQTQGKKRVFRAKRAVVTLPLGVLQSESVAISPLPEKVMAAARQMRMGDVMRATLVFRKRFWGELPDGESSMREKLRRLSFLYAEGCQPAVWWTTHPQVAPTLTAWSGGPRSEGLRALDLTNLAERLVEAVAKLFSLRVEEVRSQLIRCVSHDWQHDPYSGGSYSYAAVGGSLASEEMSEPVQGTLFFAGEHTDTTGHWGTVHGAMRSGMRAAAQILEVALPVGARG
jgi:monoamine oxidase